MNEWLISIEDLFDELKKLEHAQEKLNRKNPEWDEKNEEINQVEAKINTAISCEDSPFYSLTEQIRQIVMPHLGILEYGNLREAGYTGKIGYHTHEIRWWFASEIAGGGSTLRATLSYNLDTDTFTWNDHRVLPAEFDPVEHQSKSEEEALKGFKTEVESIPAVRRACYESSIRFFYDEKGQRLDQVTDFLNSELSRQLISQQEHDHLQNYAIQICQ